MIIHIRRGGAPEKVSQRKKGMELGERLISVAGNVGILTKSRKGKEYVYV